MYLRGLLLIVLVLSTQLAIAQHHEAEESAGRHRIAPLMGFTYVFNTAQSTDKSVAGSILVPTIGFDYIYKLSHKWGLGWNNDLELSSYSVEGEMNEEIRRERAYVSALVVSYELLPRFAVFAGYGVELERHQNFQVFTTGIAYAVPFRDQWALALGLNYDYKEIYQSLAFKIIFERKFGKKKL